MERKKIERWKGRKSKDGKEENRKMERKRIERWKGRKYKDGKRNKNGKEKRKIWRDKEMENIDMTTKEKEKKDIEKILRKRWRKRKRI
jgi:hypothetical protein